MAYGSDESGQPEVYVRAFSLDNGRQDSAAGGRWQISAGGGIDPRWRGDGKELYYHAFDGEVMAVEVAANPTFQPGPPKELFPGPPILYRPGASMPSGYGVSGDGKRFLFQEMAEPTGQSSVTIGLNCLRELEQQVPVKWCRQRWDSVLVSETPKNSCIGIIFEKESFSYSSTDSEIASSHVRSKSKINHQMLGSVDGTGASHIRKKTDPNILACLRD
jgi:hypothetical protein